MTVWWMTDWPSIPSQKKVEASSTFLLPFMINFQKSFVKTQSIPNNTLKKVSVVFDLKISLYCSNSYGVITTCYLKESCSPPLSKKDITIPGCKEDGAGRGYTTCCFNPNQSFGLGRKILLWKADKEDKHSDPHEKRTPGSHDALVND